jgi:hypothetical protein
MGIKAETDHVSSQNHNYTKVMGIQVVFKKSKVVSDVFRFRVRGKLMISNEQVNTV